MIRTTFAEAAGGWSGEGFGLAGDLQEPGLPARQESGRRVSRLPFPAARCRSYPYLWLDALPIKVREEGRVVGVWGVCATAVSTDGHREILGFEAFTAEDGHAWAAFPRNLTARGSPGSNSSSPVTT